MREKQCCGTDDAVAPLVNIIFKHIDKPHAYATDFPSAFNMIQADILVSKMVQQELNPYLIGTPCSLQKEYRS